MPSTVEQEERLALLRSAFFPEEEETTQPLVDWSELREILDDLEAEYPLDTCDDPSCGCHLESPEDGEEAGSSIMAAMDGLVTVIEEGSYDQVIQAANVLLGYSLALADRGLDA